MRAPSPLDIEKLLAEEPFVRALAGSLWSDEADDLVQQTWLTALGSGGASVRQPRPWLARIVHNLALNLRRSNLRRQVHERAAAVPDLVPSSDELMEREERRRALVCAVDRLPPHLRAVVLLRWFENLPPRVIATELGLPAATVSHRLHRALALLRERLDAEHAGNRRAWLLPLLPFGTARTELLAANRSATVTQSLAAVVPGVLLMTFKAKLASAVAILLLAAIALWPGPGSAVLASRADPTTELPPVIRAEAPVSSAPVALPVDAVRRDLVPAASQPAARTGTLLVHARYGDDGTPVADLTLIVVRSGGDPRVGSRRARTDASGNARFEGLDTGRVSLMSNRTFALSPAVDIGAGLVAELEYVLKPGIDIAGIVVDDSGSAVPGAEVQLAFLLADRDAEHATTTGADGRFVLRACFFPCLVGARAAGHGWSGMQLLLGLEAGAKFDVRIVVRGPAGTVAGVVLGPRGNPVANAVVRIGTGRLDLIGAALDPESPPLPAQVRTGPDGRFCAVGLAAGEHPVAVRAMDLAPWSGTCRVVADVATELQVNLDHGVAIAGTVRGSDGALVPKALVTVGTTGELVSYRTRSAADGTFHLGGLPTGPFELAVTHEDQGKASVQLHGAAGELLPCDVHLARGTVVRGRVLLEDGTPVARAGVHVGVDGDQGRGSSTDVAGRFAISNCPEGKLVTVRVEGSGIERLQQSDVDPNAGELVLRARRAIRASVRIIGTVVAPDGKPVANAVVSATGSGANIGSSDAAGRFEIGPLAPGALQVRVETTDLPVFRSEPRELAANAVWDLGTVRLVPGGTVRVRLLDGAAPGAAFALWDAQGSWLTSLDPAARWQRAKAVAAGSHRLRVSGPEVAAMSLPVEVRAGEETVIDVQPQRGVSRRLEFAASGGWQGVARLSVRIALGIDTVLETSVAPRGDRSHAVSCRLLPGRYTVTATGAGRSGSAELTVVATEADATVRIDVH